MANDRAAGRAAVREVLARIVASRAFEKSERARELLNFVVNEEQAGRGDRLKAFTIAVDVFGKDASFDASSDPLVRVHAGRVRELLEQYYEEEGAGERLRILIPKGGYVPVYEEVEPHPAAFRKTVDSTTLAGVLGDHARDTSEDGISAALRGAIGGQTSVVTFASPSPTQKAGGNVDGETISKSRRQPRTASDETGLAPQILRHMKLYWLAIATIIMMLAYVVYSLLGEQVMAPVTTAEVNAPSRGHRGSITSDLLPSVGIVAEDDKPETVLVANELQNMLPKFDTIRLITGDGSTSTTNYRFSVISVAPGKAAVRLVNVASGEVVMTSEVDTSVRAALDGQMARIGSLTATDGGAIFADVAANDNGNSLTRCIILNHEYFRDQTDALHREAWDCFDGIAKRGVKSPLVYAELASLMVESVADKRGYPLDASMEQAQRYAEQALSRGPQSAHAHRRWAMCWHDRGRKHRHCAGRNRLMN
ncbi:MAG: hypothetical protein KDJ67_00055 [Nitratireductor sp.]|nr:hypothetical protein [Nitratireductor sp.]